MQAITFTSGAAVASLVVAKFPVNLLRIRGNMADDANGWLMLFDTVEAAADLVGDAPKVCYPITKDTNYAFDFSLAGVNFATGLVAVFSATDDVYTATAAGTGWIMGELDQYAMEPLASLTAVGDLTTDVVELEVWAESAGPKALKHVQIVNNDSTADEFALFFAHDDPAADDLPLLSVPVPTTGLVLDFGFMGWNIQSWEPTSESVNEAIGYHTGCTIAMSSTSGKLTASEADWSIKARY